MAVVAGGHQQACDRRLTDERTVVGRAGTEPGGRLEQLVLVDDGHDPTCGVEELEDRAGLHAQVEPLLLDGRAHDDGAVGPWDEIARATVDEAADGPTEPRAVAGTEPEGEPLHRADRWSEVFGQSGELAGAAPGSRARPSAAARCSPERRETPVSRPCSTQRPETSSRIIETPLASQATSSATASARLST